MMDAKQSQKRKEQVLTLIGDRDLLEKRANAKSKTIQELETSLEMLNGRKWVEVEVAEGGMSGVETSGGQGQIQGQYGGVGNAAVIAVQEPCVGGAASGIVMTIAGSSNIAARQPGSTEAAMTMDTTSILCTQWYFCYKPITVCNTCGTRQVEEPKD